MGYENLLDHDDRPEVLALFANLRRLCPSSKSCSPTTAASSWDYEDRIYRFYHGSFKVYVRVAFIGRVGGRSSGGVTASFELKAAAKARLRVGAEVRRGGASRSQSPCWRSRPARATPGAPGGKPNVWKDRTNPNAVTAIAFGGEVVYALTYAGRVRAWTGDTQPVRTLALEHVLALADDGSVAVTAAKEGQHGDRVDIWALPAATPLCHHSFEHGIEKVLAVSARAIALLVNTGYTTNPDEGIPQLPPPRWSFEMWSFTDDGIGVRGSTVSCDEHARFSADGLRFICAKDFGWVRWLDSRERELGITGARHRLASPESIASAKTSPRWRREDALPSRPLPIYCCHSSSARTAATSSSRTHE